MLDFAILLFYSEYRSILFIWGFWNLGLTVVTVCHIIVVIVPVFCSHLTTISLSLCTETLILHQYLWEGIVKEAGQSPAQSASAGTAGSQLAMAPDQGSRYWSWPDVSCICVLNHSRTPLLQTSCTTNVGLCHLIVQFWIQKHSLHLRVLEFRPYSCYSLPYYCCDCACVLLTLDYHQSVPLHWNSSKSFTL